MSGQGYAFDDPNQSTAFGTEDDAVAKSQQQIAQAQQGFDENRAFRNYLQTVEQKAAKKNSKKQSDISAPEPETQTRYSPTTMY